MTVKDILAETIEILRAIPERLSGDDSPLADPWEEIKEQVQHELSPFWPVYLETMESIIAGPLASLSAEDRVAIAAAVRVPSKDTERLAKAILKKLIARARKERIKYKPFAFTHFRYTIYDMSVYAEVLGRKGLFTCEIMAYSGAAPSGERGEVNTDIIQATMSEDEFEEARRQDWPDKWVRGAANSSQTGSP